MLDAYVGSDEEFLAASLRGEFATVEEVDEGSGTAEEEVINEEVIADETEDAVVETNADSEEAEVDSAESESQTAEQEDAPATETTEVKTEEVADTPVVSTADEDMKKILAPFKASGKEMQVKNADEAIRLMQMGANYADKMRDLKPKTRILKALEENGLISEDRILLLIDASKGNPEAVKRLMREAKIDPLTVDLDEKDDYTPTSQLPTEQVMNVNSVLDDLQSSPHYRTIITDVKNWDNESKAMISEKPILLNYIEDHMQSGIYQLVTKEMARQDMLGNLAGLSTFQRYQKCGDMLNETGAFNALVTPIAKNAASTPVAEVVSSKTSVDAKADKRRAAASTSSSSSPSTSVDDDYKLTDEEYMKKYGRN